MRVPVHLVVADLTGEALAAEPQAPTIAVPAFLVRDPGLAVSLAVALCLSVASAAYFYHAGLTTGFEDARSRLMIARTVLDGRHPGLAQLGGIWPPFPQAYMLPLVWDDTLYNTGIAGAVPSAICYVASSAFLYKLVARLTMDRIAGVIAIVAFSGPNLLYLQSVPMSELPFIACLLGGVYFAVSWMLHGSLRPLFLAGLAACLGTLTRYEGWVFLALLTAVVVCFCWRAGHSYGEIEGLVLLFGLVGFLGVGFWLLWNRVIFGDTLYFLHSQYGTKAINSVQLAAFPPSARPAGNLRLSFLLFGWAVVDNVGIVVAGLAALGLARLARGRRFGPATIAALVLLLFPLPFSVAAIYLGAEVIGDPHAMDIVGTTNIRYGLLLAPAVGFLVGWLAQGRWLRWPVLTACLISSLLVWRSGLVNVDDYTTVTSPRGRMTTQVGDWLRQHYDGGLLLVQRRTNENMLFTSRIPLDEVVYEGDQGEWSHSLRDPLPAVRWIVLDEGDPAHGAPPDDVWTALHAQPRFLARYQLAYQDGPIEVYRSKAA